MSGFLAPRLSVVQDIELADGRVLRVRRWPGTGAPLVLLHGLLDCALGWQALAAASARPCVAFELPGFGGSDLPRRPRLASYAEDIAEGIELLGLGPLTLVGHSLGGGVAAATAEICPAVDALGLLAPVGFGPVRLADACSLPLVRETISLLLPRALSSPLAVSAGYTALVTRGRLPASEVIALVRENANGSAPGVRAAVAAIAAAGHGPLSFPRRGLAFAGRVAALWGRRDALVPPTHADGLRRAAPHALVELWPGLAHHPQRECPERLAGWLQELLGAPPAPARMPGRRRPLRARAG